MLVEASYKLSANQQKIILLLASSIGPDDEAFQPYRIAVKDFADILGINNHNIYQETLGITKDLLSQTLLICKEKSSLQINWLSSVEYFNDSGSIELCFDPKLKPFLLRLKECFTTYRLQEIIQLRSSFSIRIYELLKQYQKIGFRAFKLAELRQILGIDKNKYRLYSNFKNKVLLVAKNELSEKTDLAFDFQEIKSGRKVDQIKFIIHSSASAQPNPAPPAPFADVYQENLFKQSEYSEASIKQSMEALINMLPETYKNQDSIKKLLLDSLEKHGFDHVARNIEYANDNSNATNPGANITRGSNYRNYLAKALKGDFGLAYQEDTAAEKLKEQQAKAAAAEQERQKRLEQEKMDRERELSGQARQILATMSEEELKEIELAAISKLSPEMKKMAIENRFTAQIAINRAMEKVIIERYFKTDSLSQAEGKLSSGEA